MDGSSSKALVRLAFLKVAHEGGEDGDDGEAGEEGHAEGEAGDENGEGDGELDYGTLEELHATGSLRPSGGITVDDGAVRALRSGKSLLPAGVIGVEGKFQRGDAVVVRNAGGGEVGRGLIAYGAADARKIMGRQSREIADILGFLGREEMIHRDDLALTGVG